MIIQNNVSLKSFTTFGIEASARYYVEANTMDDILQFCNEKTLQTIPKLILGGGSNLLFTKNFDGVVMRNQLKGIEIVDENSESVFVKSYAGELWHNLVTFSIQNNFAGIENLSLIPGCVGASPMQNIGAYGVEIKDCFHELEAIHLKEGHTRIFSADECEFGYRESVFKQKLKNQYIITSVTFKLNKNPVFNTSYGAIEKELEAMGVAQITIAAIGEAVCRIRRSKLPDPSIIGNAGSFFKNPVVSNSKFSSLKNQFPEIVAYPGKSGEMKLAAGWLIEQCGWKGYREGDAGVHKNQALVLVNYKEATGTEIYNLSQKILDSVYQKFSVQLEREVNIV